MRQRRAWGRQCEPTPGAYSSPVPAAVVASGGVFGLRQFAKRLGERLGETPFELFLAARAVRLRLHAREIIRRLRHADVWFDYCGRRLRTVNEPYNRTWLNERQLELAVAFDFLDRLPPGAVGLEVGNVLAHYRRVTHHVVDKYERAPAVDNIDVVDLPGGRRYDYIVAISTLEHAGRDESPRDHGKSAHAVRHLRSLLRPGGTLLLTVPVGYNDALDAAVLSLPVCAKETYALDRTWRWRRRPVTERDFRYHYELRCAQAVWIGEIPYGLGADGPSGSL